MKTLRRFRHLFPLNLFCEVSKYQIGVVFEDYGREYGILLLSALLFLLPAERDTIFEVKDDDSFVGPEMQYFRNVAVD